MIDAQPTVKTVAFCVVKAAGRPILQRRAYLSDGALQTKVIGKYFGVIEEPSSNPSSDENAHLQLSRLQPGNRLLLFLDPSGLSSVWTGGHYEDRPNGNLRFHIYQPLTSHESENLGPIGNELWLEQKPETKP